MITLWGPSHAFLVYKAEVQSRVVNPGPDFFPDPNKIKVLL